MKAYNTYEEIRNDIKKDTIKNLWGRLVDFVIIAILAYLGFKK